MEPEPGCALARVTDPNEPVARLELAVTVQAFPINPDPVLFVVIALDADIPHGLIVTHITNG